MLERIKTDQNSLWLQSGNNVTNTVEFQELTDNECGGNETDQGHIRMYRWTAPDGFVLQFRAKQSLKDTQKKHNLIATSHLAIDDIAEMHRYALKRKYEGKEEIVEKVRRGMHQTALNRLMKFYKSSLDAKQMTSTDVLEELQEISKYVKADLL